MSEFHIEKHRASAVLTFATGTPLSGEFFLSKSSPAHAGPERVVDLLNASSGFFPFQAANGHTTLINRAHVLTVALFLQKEAGTMPPGDESAISRQVSMVLSTGLRVEGQVTLHLRAGRDRLSDYAEKDERFRSLELKDGTLLLVNTAYIVELAEVTA